jgi:hypothetical protein
LWINSAALQQQRHDGGVSPNLRRVQRRFMARVDVCAPVKEKSDHLQPAGCSGRMKRFVFLSRAYL